LHRVKSAEILLNVNPTALRRVAQPSAGGADQPRPARSFQRSRDCRRFFLYKDNAIDGAWGFSGSEGNGLEVRILHLTSSYPEGAGDPAGHFIEAEARAAASSCAVTVVAPLATGTRTCSDEGGLLVIRLAHGNALGWPGAAARLHRNPLRTWGYLAWLRAAAREIAVAAPDHMYVHWPIPNTLAVGRPFFQHKAIALTWVSHGADIRFLISLPIALRSAILRTWLPRIERWRFVSEALQQALEVHLSATETRALALKVSIEAPAIGFPSAGEIVEAGIRNPLPKKRPLLVSVGRLIASKRVEDAITEALHSGGSLVVIGDGPERARLERSAKRSGAEVLFTGKLSRTEALSWIARADALVMTSEAEGLSTVVREAEALGTKVRWLRRNVT
jgi:teichuronic acid biosynthesis glycosyltransferase TuaC